MTNKIELPDVNKVGDYRIVNGEPYINERKVVYTGEKVGEGCDSVYLFEGCDDVGNKEVYLAGGFGLEVTINIDKNTGEINYYN